jgi:hypothetical protein
MEVVMEVFRKFATEKVVEFVVGGLAWGLIFTGIAIVGN